jgi:hypothetical protein
MDENRNLQAPRPMTDDEVLAAIDRGMRRVWARFPPTRGTKPKTFRRRRGRACKAGGQLRRRGELSEARLGATISRLPMSVGQGTGKEVTGDHEAAAQLLTFSAGADLLSRITD